VIYLFKKIVFDCKQATLLSIKQEEGRITFFEKLKLSYHLLYCDPCRRFIEQSKQIDQIGQELDQRLSSRPPFTLPEVTKDRIQQQIDQLDR
jgi:hypothetical protein